MAEHRCFCVFLEIIKPMNITLGPGVRVVEVTSAQQGKRALGELVQDKR